jgi:hypothetical protein
MADYSMRARNFSNTAYVYWVSIGAPDPNGEDAPEAILPFSSVVLGEWGGPGILFERVVNEFRSIQVASGPVTLSNPGGGMTLVRLDSLAWVGGDTIALPPAPTLRSRLVIKAATGVGSVPVFTILGNGNDIDDSEDRTLSANFESLSLLFIGTQWVRF